MKVIATILACIATFFVLSAVIPTAEEAEIYDSFVRLHVIANSNSDEDQSLKLKVRDKVLDKINEYDVTSKEEAFYVLKECKGELEKIAETEIRANGKSYDVSIEIGEESYPTRYYDDFCLPAGNYNSVRVVIGDGDGENWWCVLYPPLCREGALSYEDAYIDVGLTKDQYDLITQSSGKYKVKFKLLELAASVAGIDY